jgi:hypothetical protein
MVVHAMPWLCRHGLRHKPLILAEFPCLRLTEGRFFAMRFHIAKTIGFGITIMTL